MTTSFVARVLVQGIGDEQATLSIIHKAVNGNDVVIDVAPLDHPVVRRPPRLVVSKEFPGLSRTGASARGSQQRGGMRISAIVNTHVGAS